MRYRPDIDGLRAVAILPVLFYHAGWDIFSGGYVGVDVFFVISGFLITRILADEIAHSRFSLTGFYERRLRRILPGLFAVIIASSGVAALLLVPLDFHEFTKSVIAAVFFASNALFFRQAGYFDDQSAFKPLLHTWSLSVEEQFYIFFPIMLWVVYRYCRNHVFLAVALVTAASFAFNVWGVRDMPGFTFFMAPARVWELLAGTLLALSSVPASENRIVRESASWLGLALIAYAVFTFTPSTTFPGINALPPVVGAALLIRFAQHTSAGWLLSRGPLVFVGLISYSLYLWHWPIISFSEYYLLAELKGWGAIAAVAVSFLVAALSWRYVERPFRVKGAIPRRAVFKAAAATMASMVMLCAASLASSGWSTRFPEEVARLESFVYTYNPRRDQCQSGQGHMIAIDESCTYGAASRPSFAVWGDSHAGELAYALGAVAERHNTSVMQFSYAGCPPSLGMHVPDRPNCRRYNDEVARFLRGHSEIATVVLVARYEIYQAQAGQFADGFQETVATLLEAGKKVVLVYPIPTTSISVPRALARHAARGVDPGQFSIDKTAYLRRNSYAFDLLDSFTEANVVHVFPHERLCGDVCAVQAEGTPLYFDKQHLNIFGTERLMPLFEPLFPSTTSF